MRMKAQAGSVSGGEQPLAETDARFQLLSCALTGANLIRRRRLQQPMGQCLLSCARTKGTEQLEDRTLSEQVQVTGIRVHGIQKAIAALSHSGPSVFQPRHSAFVVSDDGLDISYLLEHFLMHDCEHDKSAKANEQRPNPVKLVEKPDNEKCNEKSDCNLGIPEIPVPSLLDFQLVSIQLQ